MRRAAWGAVVVALALVVTTWERSRRARRTREAEARRRDDVRHAAVDSVVAPRGERSGARTISVVIPAFNEGDSIGATLDGLPGDVLGLTLEPTVVVDGGDDATAQIAEKDGAVVAVHSVNLGQGDALRTGFDVAGVRGAEIVVTFDADGQHDPDDLPSLIAPILAGDADYVQGSRYLGTYDDAGGPRDLGIRVLTKLINALSGAGVSDCTNGYRAIRADRLASLDLEEDRFSAPELIIQSARHGLKMREVPVHIRTREHGTSKKPRRLGYPIGFVRVALRTWRRSARVPQNA